MSTSRNKAVYHFQALHLDARAMELDCLSPEGSLSWLRYVTASVLYTTTQKSCAVYEFSC